MSVGTADSTQLAHRVGITRAALTDMGRPDLADCIVGADELLAAGRSDVCWRGPSWPDPDDEILLRRGAALASLSTGFDEQSVFCEQCIRATNRPDCTRVTRSQFLAHNPCDFSSRLDGGDR